jgi:membrane protein implicated in regulation of membrane protease activity
VPSLTGIKLILAVIGLLLFAAGARWENATLRWAAIALIAVAFLMRFVPRKKDDRDPPSGPPPEV